MVCNIKYNLEKHASAASTNNNKGRNSFFSEIFEKDRN
jgi:hypothetical protein